MHQILGLGGNAEDIYRLLLAQGPLHVDTFANPAEVAVIERLRAEGLVYGEGLITAVRPGLALQGRLLERQRAMNAAEALIAEFESLYRSNSGHRAAQVPVEVLTDVEHVRKIFSQIEQTAREELLSFATAPYRVVSGEQDPPSGHEHPRCRILMEEEVFSDAAAVSAAEHARRWGCEIRVIDRLPFKLLIGDRLQALVPQLPGEAAPVLLVHPGSIMDALVATFEVYWDQALPRQTAWRNNGTDAERPTEQEITILRHLRRGATEARIATTLGISERTVKRRIRDLMDRAGVTTRFQLGEYATRQGWLSKILDV